MREELEALGWYLRSQCSCGGTTRQNFRHAGHTAYEIEIAPLKGTFFIKKNEATVKGASGKAAALHQKLEENGLL